MKPTKKSKQLSLTFFALTLVICILMALIYGATQGINLLGGLLFNDKSLLCWKSRGLRSSLHLNKLAITSDSNTLITGGKHIKFWDMTTGKKQFTSLTTRDWISNIVTPTSIDELVLTPDEKILVTAIHIHGALHSTYQIQIWDIVSRQVIHQLDSHTSRIRALIVSSDNQTLVSQDMSGIIHFWDLPTGKLKKTVMTQQYKRLSIIRSQDGKYIAGMNDQGILHVWDMKTGRVIAEMQAHPSHTPLALSADNTKVLIQNAGDVKRIQDIKTGQVQQTIKGSFIENPFAVTPNGKQALIQTSMGIKLYDLQTGSALKQFRQINNTVNIIATPDGTSFLTTSSSGKHTLNALATGQKIFQFEGKNRGWSQAFSPNSKRFALLNRYGNDIAIWDLKMGQRLHQFCND